MIDSTGDLTQPSDSDDADLRSSLDALAGLVTEGLRLEDVLERVATFAVEAVPGADGAGVTLLRSDRTENLVEALAASHPFVAEVDEIQYSVLNEGPCITAALERRTVRSGSLGGDQTWTRFGPRVGRLGVHSVLSLPMLMSDYVVGAINVYARQKDAFDEHAAWLGESFARPAAVAVHNAQVLARALALAGQLQTALATRPVIDQAIGLIRGRTGISAEEAIARLRTISQQEHRKLSEVAAQIVDQAVRRATAARASEPEVVGGSQRLAAAVGSWSRTSRSESDLRRSAPHRASATCRTGPRRPQSAFGSGERSTASWSSVPRWPLTSIC